MKEYPIAIIGAGAAGQMAALRSVLNNIETLWFLGDGQSSRRSRATWVESVDNIPGMFDKKRPINSTTKEVIKFIESEENLSPLIKAVKGSVTKIEKKENHFILSCKDETYHAQHVVLCTGTMDVQPLINGEIDPVFPYANRGDILYCIRCDGHKVMGKAVSVIGHSDSAAWVSVLLKERYDLPEVYLLTNGKTIEASEEVHQLMQNYQIKIYEEPILSILGDPKKEMEGFELNSGEKILTPKAFAVLGSIVYNDLVKPLGVAVDERDHLITNKHFETSVPGLYAAGDLVSGKKKQVYTAWDMAVDAVDNIDLKLRREKRKQMKGK
ncbi:MAG: NAD(P)/FAD-dependent oxidoreductase [Deltaproteobacteria bacterium]|nr:NAD(P)/FAD-dependent oxidoreductase [Deltaproteobacteria bacterium]